MLSYSALTTAKVKTTVAAILQKKKKKSQLSKLMEREVKQLFSGSHS